MRPQLVHNVLSMESYVTLTLLGSNGTADHVTTRLGIAPTSCVESGEPVRPRASKLAENSIWRLGSDTQGESVELEDALCRLLDKIEPKADALRQLEDEGYYVSWRCVVATHDLEHDIELEFATLRRLVALPGRLLLDVYDDGTLSENPPQ